MTMVYGLGNLHRASMWWRNRLARVRLGAAVSAATAEADAILRQARHHIPHCVTRYSRKRLADLIGDVSAQCRALVENARGRQGFTRNGRKTSAALIRRLSGSLETMQAACEADSAHRHDCETLLLDRDRLAREAAPLLLGVADAEFKRWDAQFRATCQSFERCRKVADIEEALQHLRRAAEAMKRIVESVQQVQQGLDATLAAYERIDRRAVAGDPRADQVYVSTGHSLPALRDRLARGEIGRSMALLTAIEQNLSLLENHVDGARRYAATEVELWRRIVTLCPVTTSSFAARVTDTPLEPGGDALAAWVSLRPSIENAVNRAAADTRRRNSEALGDRDAQSEWRDADPGRLLRFANASFRSWRILVSDPRHEMADPR